MRVVFKSSQPFLQVDKGSVNRAMAVTGFRYNERTGDYEDTGVYSGLVVLEKELTTGQGSDLYCFCEGRLHNELTLTDPEEIQKMREYAQGRSDDLITEITEK